MYRYTHILFDFDGTLADSSECAVAATQKAFAQFDVQPPAASEIVRLMGIPVEVSFKAMGAAHLCETQFGQLLAAFRESYRKLGDNMISAFPDAAHCLQQLRQRGARTALTTSKKSDVALRNAQAIGLAAHLDWIVGSDCVKKYKSDSEGIFSVLDLFGLA